ncbi:MAG TPA: hypothetical protein VHQ65_03145 [Thermoanaerobaculia bacterium]|nr:hypothetical protein [Thermoanaerobaculia bacterium]
MRRPESFSAAVLLPLVLAALAAFAPAAAAGPNTASPYGVNVHAPSGALLEETLAAVERAGIGWIRIDFVWAAVETAPGVYDWRLYDEIVAAAAARGVEVLATIAYTPQWATDGPVLAGVPRSAARWRELCRRAAQRYAGRITHWEVWNEPNLEKFWAGTREQYLDVVLHPGIDGLRAGDPAARVGGPGLAHLTTGNSDWYRWLPVILGDAGHRLDFLTHHVYDSDSYHGVTRKLEAPSRFRDQPGLWDVFPPSLADVLAWSAWDGPVWLTETGWASDRIGEPQQAEQLAGLLGQWLTGDPGRSWIDKIFVYELRDDGRPGIPLYGLLAADGREKLAFTAYGTFIDAWPAVAPAPPLVLADGRFGIEVRWRDPRSGDEGVGEPLPFSERTGFFWFFDPANVELVVKVLDGTSVNGFHWVFYGGLSDVEYWITVTDHATGERRTYHNPPLEICGAGDTAAFPLPGETVAAGPGAAATELAAELPPPVTTTAGGLFAEGCAGVPGGLCLGGGRFFVEVAWRDPRSGTTGAGGAVAGTEKSGFFWFFRPDNLELAVKVLDGRGVNGHWWVLFGALSDVEYEVRVTDTATGTARSYHNPPGNLCGQADTAAF